MSGKLDIKALRLLIMIRIKALSMLRIALAKKLRARGTARRAEKKKRLMLMS